MSNLSVKDMSSMHFSEIGVASRILIEKVKETDNESDSVMLFKEEILNNGGHICRIKNFNVWHGGNIGPRKFRKKSLCKCVCDGLGKLCKCDCGAVFKMLLEFRESEVFRGYGPAQKKHKKARRFIAKRTLIKDLLKSQFQDPHPYQRL